MAIRLPSYLHRNRYGIFGFRVVIPSNLRIFFPAREYRLSLKTSVASEARTIAYALASFVHGHFSETKKCHGTGMESQNINFLQTLKEEREQLVSKTKQIDELSPTEIADLIETAASLLDKEFSSLGDALRALSKRQQEINANEASLLKEGLFAAINSADEEIDAAFCDLHARQAKHKQNVAALREDFLRFQHELKFQISERKHQEAFQTMTAMAAAERDRIAEFASEMIAQAVRKIDSTSSQLGSSSLAQHVSAKEASTPNRAGLMLSEVVEDFTRAKLAKKSWTEKTAEEYRSVYSLFIRIVGDIPITAIDDETIVTYLETLQKLPPNLNKSPQYIGKSIAEIIELAKEPMKPRTVNKNIERVSSLFKWAMGKRKYSLTYNPAAGMSVDESRTAKRQPFTDSELIALFSNGGFKTRTFQNAYAYWLMPLGLLTGARLGELCQLYLSDFVEHNGVACIDISDEEEGQRLKNSNAKRLVPIHSKLIELGLLQYVESLRSSGHERLFPELKQRRDGYAQAASNWFQRHKKASGIEDKHTKVFHSFRHTFISTLLNEEVPEHAVAQIVGHEANLITGKVYWNAKDAAKRKPTVELFQPSPEVWRLVPNFKEVSISCKYVTKSKG